jgi:tetratricopeptide (TPR) repeat protein
VRKAVRNIFFHVGFIAVISAILMAFALGPAFANSESDVLRAKGSAEIYNLDRDLAIETFKQAVAADHEDAAAYRGLASALWLTITFRRGNMTVDDYLGSVKRSKTPAPPPPADVASAFNDAINQAISLSRKKIALNARDADAHYQLAAAVALRASYIATVDNSLFAAFKAAREAYEEDEIVQQVDPKRKEAGLVVGLYRYIVSTQALPMRWMAYMAGFGGGKEHGIRLIREAAEYPGESQIDARFALVLILNRERRYDEALKQLAILRDQYPRNRLVWLESGSTLLRAGRPTEAERFLSQGLERFARDSRSKMFGEESLWHYKRGWALVLLGKTADGEADLKRAVDLEGRNWVHGRSYLELGRLALKGGNRAAARQELHTAIMLCESDNDPAAVEEAKILLKDAS